MLMPGDFIGERGCVTHSACDCIQARLKTLEAENEQASADRDNYATALKLERLRADEVRRQAEELFGDNILLREDVQVARAEATRWFDAAQLEQGEREAERERLETYIRELGGVVGDR